MHPLLAGRLRQTLYFAVWAGIGVLLAAVMVTEHPRPFGQVAVFIVPLTLCYAFACLSAWWVCRANPLANASPERLLVVAGAASAMAAIAWVVLGALWAGALGRLTHMGIDRVSIGADLVTLAIAGVVLYAQSMAANYFLLTIESARNAERRVFESQVAAREAELRALRAQLNPHFLFNSLNSISALAGSDPEAARRMCQRLGDFLRTSLSLGGRERVALKEELGLAEHYLAIEQVRFGTRLALEQHIGDGAESCWVPPLLVQPLIENAVKHGVADRVEGGTVRIDAEVRGRVLEIVVENPRDPAAPPRRGQGLGLENVRQRLSALDPIATRVDVFAEPERYRVRLTLPAVSVSNAGAAPGADPSRESA